MTVSNIPQMDLMIEEMLYDNMVSDCEIFKGDVSRSYLRNGKEVIIDGETQLLMTTADDRLEEVMKLIEKKMPNSYLDIVVTTPVTGNLKYIDFVNTQTMTRQEWAVKK